MLDKILPTQKEGSVWTKSNKGRRLLQRKININSIWIFSPFGAFKSLIIHRAVLPDMVEAIICRGGSLVVVVGTIIFCGGGNWRWHPPAWTILLRILLYCISNTAGECIIFTKWFNGLPLFQNDLIQNFYVVFSHNSHFITFFLNWLGNK